MKVQNILTPLWFALKIKFVLKIRKQCVGNVTDFFIAKQIKKPYDCALFCCKALMQRSRALKKKGETLDYVSCFPQPTLLQCSSRFLRALKLNRAQSRLLQLLIIIIIFPAVNRKQTVIQLLLLKLQAALSSVFLVFVGHSLHFFSCL